MDGLFLETPPFLFAFFFLKPHSSEKNQLRWGRHRLETDVCVAGHQSADPEAIQNYVKKVREGTKLQTSNRCYRLTLLTDVSGDLAHKRLSAAEG